MNKVKFNRAEVDVGNILAMEHVNVTVPDQPLATLFYVNLLGFTRDPYMDFGPFNVWVNVGRQQFHLPIGNGTGRVSVAPFLRPRFWDEQRLPRTPRLP